MNFVTLQKQNRDNTTVSSTTASAYINAMLADGTPVKIPVAQFPIDPDADYTDAIKTQLALVEAYWSQSDHTTAQSDHTQADDDHTYFTQNVKADIADVESTFETGELRLSALMRNVPATHDEENDCYTAEVKATSIGEHVFVSSPANSEARAEVTQLIWVIPTGQSKATGAQQLAYSVETGINAAEGAEGMTLIIWYDGNYYYGDGGKIEIDGEEYTALALSKLDWADGVYPEATITGKWLKVYFSCGGFTFDNN